MSRNGGGSCELGIGVHASQCIRHTVGSRTCRHIIRMKRTACAAAGCNGEVLFAFFQTLFFIGACNRVLESCRVCGVTCNGNIYSLFPHDGNAFRHIIRSVTVNFCPQSFGVRFSPEFFNLACVIIHLCLNIGESVNTGDNLCGIFS